MAIREAQRDASKVNRADALCARFDMRSEADPAIRYLVAKNHFVRGRAGLAARTLGPLVAEKNYPATVLFLASADQTHPLLIPVEQEWRERLPSMREQAQTLHQNPDMFDDEITPGPRSSPVFEGLYPTPVDALARRVTQRARPNSAA